MSMSLPALVSATNSDEGVAETPVAADEWEFIGVGMEAADAVAGHRTLERAFT